MSGYERIEGMLNVAVISEHVGAIFWDCAATVSMIQTESAKVSKSWVLLLLSPVIF